MIPQCPRIEQGGQQVEKNGIEAAPEHGEGRFSTMPRLHAAVLAYIPVILRRMGRVRCLALRDRSFGASGERQDDQERAKSSSPVHYVIDAELGAGQLLARARWRRCFAFSLALRLFARIVLLALAVLFT
jgi:hypothetical protein